MPDEAAFCPGCGRAMGEVERAQGMVGVLPEKVAGALAYLLLPAIVFLLVEPYSKDRFVRFHSFQCLGLCLAGFALFFIPAIGRLSLALVFLIVILAFFAVWVVLMVKALQGEMFKLPVVGHFAERHISVD
jgi:uncharacterized membrane protein